MNALYYNSTGSNSVAIGDSALYYNDADPGYNTAVGSNALYSNTFGSYNTALGYHALYNTTSGNFNTAVGFAAYPVVGTVFNFTGIGYNVGSSSSISNSVEIGDINVVSIKGEVGFSTYSDARIKENIKDDVPGLSFINKLRPVTYNLNIHKQNEMMYAGKKEEADWPGKYDIEKKLMTGFVAQEVELAAQQCGYDFHGVTKPANSNGLYTLTYSDFVVPLVKAVQEQQVIIEKLQQRIEALEKKLNN